MLYQHDREIKSKLDMKKKQIEDERKQKMETIFTREQSNRIIERLKIQKFSELFKALDSDGDGQISA
jgi:hypothetical protein